MKILFGPNHCITMLMIELSTKNTKKIGPTVLSLNIDSLNSKFDELNILIHTLAESNVFISVICIQEARIGENSNVEHLNLKKL